MLYLRCDFLFFLLSRELLGRALPRDDTAMLPAYYRQLSSLNANHLGSTQAVVQPQTYPYTFHVVDLYRLARLQVSCTGRRADALNVDKVTPSQLEEDEGLD